MLKKSIAIALVAVMCSTSAHAGLFGSAEDSSSIGKDTARVMSKVLKGRVLQVSDAKIEEAKNSGGGATMAGGIVGGALGSNGGGLASALIGAAVGAVGGAVVNSFAGAQKAQDLIIALDNGDVTNVTQAVDDKAGAFAEGDSVLLVVKGETARVIRNTMKAGNVASAQAPTPAVANDAAH
jgi:outer membrane lipoprotein SlyB